MWTEAEICLFRDSITQLVLRWAVFITMKTVPKCSRWLFDGSGEASRVDWDGPLGNIGTIRQRVGTAPQRAGGDGSKGPIEKLCQDPIR